MKATAVFFSMQKPVIDSATLVLLIKCLKCLSSVRGFTVSSCASLREPQYQPVPVYVVRMEKIESQQVSPISEAESHYVDVRIRFG